MWGYIDAADCQFLASFVYKLAEDPVFCYINYLMDSKFRIIKYAYSTLASASNLLVFYSRTVNSLIFA